MTAPRPAPRRAPPLRPLLPWGALGVLLAVLPLLFPSPGALTILNQMAIAAIFALSCNMLLGQAGMLSFGHAVYMGTGGYAAIHLMRAVERFGWPVPLPLVPLLAGLAALALALVVGLFSTRRAGTVFAMISLGVGELVAALAVILTGPFGGEQGISADRSWGLPVLGLDFARQGQVYALTAVWFLLAAGGMALFSRSAAGRMANAVRDNPDRVACLGQSPQRVRYVSFAAAGFFAGIAGGLFAINFEIMTPEAFDLSASGTVLLMTFLGGTGVFYGPVLGAVLFTLLQTVLGLETELWQLYVGLLFVATVMLTPEGLAGLVEMHRPIWQAGRLRLLIGPYLATLLPGAVAVLGLAALMEMLAHIRTAPAGQGVMTLFWITFDSRTPLPWLVAAGAAAIGAGLARRGLPGLRAAWQAATERAEGGR